MVTALYAGLIALLYLFLSYNVVLARRSQRVSVGDGGDKLVRKRMRTHANCAEYAPIGLILLMLVEMQGMPLWLHPADRAAAQAGDVSDPSDDYLHRRGQYRLRDPLIHLPGAPSCLSFSPIPPFGRLS